MKKHRNLKKYIVSIAAVLLAAFSFSLTACAKEFNTESADEAEMISQLYHESRADELADALPENALDFLSSVGFDGFQPDGIDDITPKSVIASLGELLRENAAEPIYVLSCLIGVVLLSAALETVKGGGAADAALSAVSTLCAISVAAPPLLRLTADMSETISASSNFMMIYVPVVSGLLVASGKAASGALYCGVMIFAASAVVQVTSMLIVPLLKCVMSLSVVSSACEKVRLNGVVEMFKKASRIILTFCMSLFVAFLTMKSIVTAAADSLSNRAVKFAIGSFVPLVGGALSDAYQTVISCVSLLKSGVGAAAIAAIFAMFIPAAVRCAVWQAVTGVGAAVCELFDLSRVSSLLRSLASVVSVIFAVLMCTMVLYIISTAIILIVGR